MDAQALFEKNTGLTLDAWEQHMPFARAMAFPEIKGDESIDSVEAYRKYLTLHKPWASWARDESRKPTWWNPSLYTNVDQELQRTVQDKRKV